jgi:hypothetical protein
MPDSRNIIYGLVDPRSGQLRYIGKSTSGIRRVREHSYPSFLKREQTHKTKWIRQLAEQGMTPNAVVVQELPDAEGLYEAERGWIAYFRSMGCPLTNLTDGGEGVPGHRVEASTRAKISQALKGHPGFPGSGAPKGNKNASGPRSEAVRLKMSEAQKKRWATKAVP